MSRWHASFIALLYTMSVVPMPTEHYIFCLTVMRARGMNMHWIEQYIMLRKSDTAGVRPKKINTLFPVTCLQKSRPETRDYFFLSINFFSWIDQNSTCFTWFAKQLYLEVLYEIISNHHIDENQFLHTNPRTNPTFNIYKL